MDTRMLRGVDSFSGSRKVFREHAKMFKENFGSRNKVPRVRDWQPFRMCTRDMVLTMIVLRKDVRNNVIEVDTCFINNIPQFEDHYSTMVALSVMISESFQRATKMEIRFTRNVEGKKVPLAIMEYAKKIGLQLKHVNDGVLLPSEVRLLYLSITELSRPARNKAIALHESRDITVERICFMVNNGFWTKEEMESILLGHPDPPSLLLGRFPVECRVPFLIDNAHARLAILGGALDRVMKARIVSDSSYKETVKNDREVMIRFYARHYMKIYRCVEEDIELPWFVWGSSDALVIPKGDFVFARLLPRNNNELKILANSDIHDYFKEMAAFGSDIERQYKGNVHHLFVLAADFRDLNTTMQKKIASEAAKNHIRIVLFPFTLRFLDEQGLDKITKSRRLRI